MITLRRPVTIVAELPRSTEDGVPLSPGGARRRGLEGSVIAIPTAHLVSKKRTREGRNGIVKGYRGCGDAHPRTKRCLRIRNDHWTAISAFAEARSVFQQSVVDFAIDRWLSALADGEPWAMPGASDIVERPPTKIKKPKQGRPVRKVHRNRRRRRNDDEYDDEAEQIEEE